MKTHEQTAIEIAQTTTEMATAESTARQGDVIIERVAESQGRGEATPKHGVVVVAGLHGEHRLIADSYVRAKDNGDRLVYDLADGAVLVHTDTPDGRHAPFRLAPGRWEFCKQHELGLDGVVREVLD